MAPVFGRTWGILLSFALVFLLSVGFSLAQQNVNILLNDQGDAGKLEVALQAVSERGWQATFYVTEEFARENPEVLETIGSRGEVVILENTGELVTLANGGAISGFVKDTQGNPISSVSMFTSIGPTFGFDITDSNGFYQLDSLTTGNYTVLANPPFDSRFQDEISELVEVLSGSTTQLNFTLIQGGILDVSLVNPAGPVNITRNEFFNFTAEVNCINGDLCGNVTAVLNLQGVGPIPVNSGDPFYTVNPNPVDKAILACLENMIRNEACTVNWQVNATGTGMHELFANFSSDLFREFVDPPILLVQPNQTQHVNVNIVEAPTLELFCGKTIDQFDSVITGTENADNLIGNGKNNLILGLGGNDYIEGRGGHDCIIGGAGDDTIKGQGGSDIIEGNEGNDVIYGNAGHDLIFGGSGDDTIRGGAGYNTLIGNDGNDTLIGGSGDDSIAGDAGDDILRGGGGNDTMGGGDGNDQLFGGEGNDSLNGNEGNDICKGGWGKNSKISCES